MPDTSSALSVSSAFLRRASGSFRKNSLLPVIEAILDPTVLALSLWIIGIHFEGELLSSYLILSIIAFAVSFPGASRLQSSVQGMIGDIVLGWTAIAALLLLLGFITNSIGDFSSAALFTWAWAAPLCQISAHLVLRSAAPFILKLQGPPQRAVIVGMNEQGIALALRLSVTTYARIELTGFFDDRNRERLGDAERFSILGNLEKLPEFVKEHRIQLIYLSLPMTSQPRILAVLDELKDTTASVYFVPDMFVTDLIQGQTGFVCGLPVISVCETPFTETSATVKWCSDILISAFILILISPVLLLIALAIKLDSPGPIIFKQRRYGLDGEEILVYKFRSMSVCEDGGTIQQAQKNDQRITRVGAFLRKTSLDELPQFINVLQGRMSIVGPRPHAVAHNELYRSLIKGYMIRHKVKPGITGWAQVNGFRGETDTLDKMQSRINCDLDYLRHWSLKLDLKIILRTVLVVFKDHAAY